MVGAPVLVVFPLRSELSIARLQTTLARHSAKVTQLWSSSLFLQDAICSNSNSNSRYDLEIDQYGMKTHNYEFISPKYTNFWRTQVLKIRNESIVRRFDENTSMNHIKNHSEPNIIQSDNLIGQSSLPLPRANISTRDALHFQGQKSFSSFSEGEVRSISDIDLTELIHSTEHEIVVWWIEFQTINTSLV